jgi:hypothetical protein
MDGGERGMRQLTLPALYPRRRAGKTKPAAGKYARRASNRRMASLKRRMPAWMARAVRPAIIASATLILLFGGIAAWRTGGIAALGEAAGKSVLAWTGSAGIAVDNVLVEGREKTSAERILAGSGTRGSNGACRTRSSSIWWSAVRRRSGRTRANSPWSTKPAR